MATADFTQSPTSLKLSGLKNGKLLQLRDSLIKQKIKTESEPKSEFPHIASTTRSQRQREKEKLLSISNRHLRYLFHEFCKQSYIGGAHGTFDDIAESAQVMTLSKWMTFCREFQLMDKLSSREMTQIFKLATSERPHMNIEQFCRALNLVKERTKMNPQELASNILHVDTHSATRNRLGVMKINFSGPKTNFFVQSTLTEKERKSENKKQFLFKQKQREYVLHQGMFSEHIEAALQDRKNIRRQRVEKLRNRSMLDDGEDRKPNLNNVSLVEKYKKEPLIQVSPTTTTNKSRSVFGNYSKIYEMKRASNTGSTQNGSHLPSTRSHLNPRPAEENTQSKSRIAFEQRKLNGSDVFRDEGEGEREELADEDMQEKWEIDSEAESDEILRNHYENEKKMAHSRSKEKPKDKLVDRHAKEEEDDGETDMMITRYN